MVRPSVSYASVVWAHDISLQKTNRCLTALDRLALKSITHSARSCPTSGLAVVLDLLPLPLYLRRSALHTVLRNPDIARLDWIGRSRTKNHSTSHRLQWSAALRQLDVSRITDCSKAINPPLIYRVVRDSFSGNLMCPLSLTVQKLSILP